MKIIFIGAVEFSRSMLETLLENDAQIAGVVTAVDPGINADFADLEPLCKAANIPILHTENINSSESMQWIKRHHPDVIFCMGWSSLIKRELLQLPPMGIVGFHPAHLPKNRGRHPLIWALVLGLQETASTFFIMEEAADSGDILSQEMISISVQDDASSLYEKITATAKQQIACLLTLLASDNYQRIPQDHTKATLWRRRGKRDGIIDWRMSASSIHNLIRGLSKPYIGAEFEFSGNAYKVWKSKVVEYTGTENFEPGKILEMTANDTLIVKCGEGAIEIIEMEPVLDIQQGMYL